MGDKTSGEAEATPPTVFGPAGVDAPALLPASTIAEGGRCPHCGGAHTRRQRCPLDSAPEAAPPPLPAVPAPHVASVGAPRPRFAFPAAAVRADGTVSPPAWRTLRDDAPGVRRGAVRSTARWAGAVVSTIALVSCVAVAATYIVSLTRADQDAVQALIAIFVSLAVGIVFGMGLMFVSMKTYSKFVFALLSPVLITGGFVMLVYAPVLRQMNTPELAEYQAFSALLWFGALSVMLGGVLAAMCLRWALRPHAIQRMARYARLLGSAYGVMLGISGLFAILALFRLINAHAVYTRGVEQSVVEQAIAFTAIAMWSFVPGLILTYHGISASMGEGSGEYRPPVALAGFALFGGVLVIGQLNMRSSDPIAAPMPVLHVAAAALPGLTFAAMAARGSVLRGVPVRWVSWRQWTLAIAISMAVATWIAVYVESLGGFGGVMLLLVHHGTFAHAQNWNGIEDRLRDADFILSRKEQFFAALIVASVCAPLSEEFAKGLSVRFLLQRTMTRGQAFMLGAAAGAGFGFLEAMLYGLRGISHHHLGDWWQIMLLRGGSTSLHVFCTGLTGLAWWYWTIAKRSRLAGGLFGLAVLFHATWNGVFTLLESRILGLDTLSDRTLEVIAYAIVAAVSSAFIVAIPIVARRLRDAAPPSVEGTPLAAIAPWLG